MIMPRVPPTTPTSERAAGVAKIPIPMKHLNVLKYVYVIVRFFAGVPANSAVGNT